MKLFLRLLLTTALFNPAINAQNAPQPGDLQRRIDAAQALQEGGKSEEAWNEYERLLKPLREGRPSAQLGFVLNAMSKIASTRGNYESALQLAQESADVYRQLGDAKGESHALNIRGLAEVEHGDYASARRDFEQALALARATHDTENEAQVLNNLGSAFYFEAKYLEAMRNYEAATAVVEQIPTEKWREYWRQVTDFNRATLFQRLGRYETALAIYRQVESSSKALTSSDKAHLETNLGALYRRLGDPWKALDSYRAAQAFYAKDRDADGEISVLKNIGIVYALDLQDLDHAQSIFERVLFLAGRTRNRRELMQAHLYLGETYLLRTSLVPATSEFELALNLARELGTQEEEWKALYGLGQCAGRSGSAAGAEQYYRQAIAIIEKTRVQLQLSALRAEFLGDKRNVYDSLIALLLDKNDVPGAFQFLERSRARNFQDRLPIPAPTTSEGPALTLEETQKHLDAQTVLLEYWLADDRLAVIWCTRSSAGVSQMQLTKQQRQGLGNAADALSEGRDDWRQVAASLRFLVPAAALDANPALRHVLIVPDGWLSLVPFELAPIGEGPLTLLIERADVSYLPTAALLRRPAPNHALRFPWVRQLVAFGDPLVRGSVLTAGLLRSSLQPLPYSSEEVHNIAAMTPGRSQLFLGANNRKAVFLAGTPNRALLLHVSTHAFADAASPEGSRLLFSPESPDQPADSVFLRELYGLDLSNVNMATLSACDTERGRLVRGEGVQAFSRALLAAGSRSAVTTLWRVDDRATAEFMKQFYFFALVKGEPKAAALRLAKLKFLRSASAFDNPRYWAAFVLSGEGLLPVPCVISWNQVLLIGLGTLLAVLGLSAVLLRRRRRRDR